jgi:hypothetical protein
LDADKRRLSQKKIKNREVIELKEKQNTEKKGRIDPPAAGRQDKEKGEQREFSHPAHRQGGIFDKAG